MAIHTLYWSRRGEVACPDHAPSRLDPRWADDGWQQIPEAGGRRITYQCQHCGQGAIHRPSREVPRSPLILNVDDRPATLYARDRMLRLHGFTVANAETGQAALDTARQLQPSLILLDIHLPDIDGRDVCQHVKADHALAHIPVVLISATLGGHTPVGVLDHADAFIAEPVDAEVLAGTIRQVLHGVRLRT